MDAGSWLAGCNCDELDEFLQHSAINSKVIEIKNLLVKGGYIINIRNFFTQQLSHL